MPSARSSSGSSSYTCWIARRWLARRGLRRSLAILVVYVGAISAIFAFLWLTLAPLIDEVLRFIEDFPALADS